MRLAKVSTQSLQQDFQHFLLNLRVVKKTHQCLFNCLILFGLLDLVIDFGAIHFRTFASGGKATVWRSGTTRQEPPARSRPYICRQNTNSFRNIDDRRKLRSIALSRGTESSNPSPSSGGLGIARLPPVRETAAVSQPRSTLYQNSSRMCVTVNLKSVPKSNPAKPVAVISETIASGGQKSAKSRVFASGK